MALCNRAFARLLVGAGLLLITITFFGIQARNAGGRGGAWSSRSLRETVPGVIEQEDQVYGISMGNGVAENGSPFDEQKTPANGTEEDNLEDEVDSNSSLRNETSTPTSSERSKTVHSSDPNESPFRLLIGVMSPWDRLQRRQMVRNAYHHFDLSNLPVDIVFVDANISTDSASEYKNEKFRKMHGLASTWENDTYGDIFRVDGEENGNKGKSYEYFKKVGREFKDVYTHVMKTDDDSFVNIPALVEVLRAIENHTHLYWGTTYPEEDTWHAREHWGSGYIMTMDLVYWIATSEIPPTRTVGAEDWITWWWLTQGNLYDNAVVNRTAFAGYPWPELGDYRYKEENGNGPFDRWNLVTHPLKEDFMFVDTANYYVNLEW